MGLILWSQIALAMYLSYFSAFLSLHLPVIISTFHLQSLIILAINKGYSGLKELLCSFQIKPRRLADHNTKLNKTRWGKQISWNKAEPVLCGYFLLLICCYFQMVLFFGWSTFQTVQWGSGKDLEIEPFLDIARSLFTFNEEMEYSDNKKTKKLPLVRKWTRWPKRIFSLMLIIL